MPGALAMFKWNVLSNSMPFSYIYFMLIATKIGFFISLSQKILGPRILSHNWKLSPYLHYDTSHV